MPELVPQQPIPITKPYWVSTRSAQVSYSPVGEGVSEYLQGVVEEVAEASLVARRLMDVEYTDAAVPVGPVARGVPGLPVPGNETQVTPYSAPVGMGLHRDFSLSLSDLALLERGGVRPALPDLVRAVRELARAEDWMIVDALVNQGVEHVPPSAERGVAAGLQTMAQWLRGAGYLSPLAAVVSLGEESGQDPLPLDDLGAEEHLRRLYAGGLYLFVGMPEGHVAVVVDTGPRNLRLLVGQNFELQWLRQECDGQVFRLSVGMAVLVGNPDAIRVW